MNFKDLTELVKALGELPDTKFYLILLVVLAVMFLQTFGN